jgi:hypothetical protein
MASQRERTRLLLASASTVVCVGAAMLYLVGILQPNSPLFILLTVGYAVGIVFAVAVCSTLLVQNAVAFIREARVTDSMLAFDPQDHLLENRVSAARVVRSPVVGLDGGVITIARTGRQERFSRTSPFPVKHHAPDDQRVEYFDALEYAEFLAALAKSRQANGKGGKPDD